MLMILSLLSAFVLIVNNMNIYALVALTKTNFILKLQGVIMSFGLISMAVIVLFKIRVEALALTSAFILSVYCLVLNRKIKKEFNEV